jgi:hypothetical protein
MPLVLNLRGRWNVYELLLGYSRDEVDGYRRVLGRYRAAQAAAQQGHATDPVGAAVQGLFAGGDQPVLARDAVRQASLAPAGDRWTGGRFASRSEVRTARRAMREHRDRRRSAGEGPGA